MTKINRLLVSISVLSLLVLGVILMPKNEKSIIIVQNIKSNQTLNATPDNLILENVSLGDTISLKYIFGKYSKEIKLSQAKKLSGQYYYNMPLLPVGDFEIYSNQKKILSFEVNYYKGKNDPESCYSLQSNQGNEMTCFKQYFLSRVSSKESVNNSLNELLKIAQMKGESFTCHIYAHYVGESSVFVFDTLDQALTNPFQECEKGYIHGALRSFVDIMDLKELGKTLPTVCNKFQDGVSDCIHGLGHNLYSKSVNDVQSAFANCLVFKNKLWANECASGVSMSLGWDKLANNLNLLKDEPNFVNDTCSQVNSEIVDGCYRFIMLVYNNLNKDPKLPDTLFGICETLKEPEQNYCASASSAEYAVITPGIKNTEIVRYCLRFGKSSVFKDCITGAIFKRIISDGKPVASEYCKLAITSGITNPEYCNEWKLMEQQRAKDYGKVIDPTASN